MTKLTLQEELIELRSERNDLIAFVRAVLPELKDSPLSIAGYALLEVIDHHEKQEHP